MKTPITVKNPRINNSTGSCIGRKNEHVCYTAVKNAKNKRGQNYKGRGYGGSLGILCSSTFDFSCKMVLFCNMCCLLLCLMPDCAKLDHFLKVGNLNAFTIIAHKVLIHNQLTTVFRSFLQHMIYSCFSCIFFHSIHLEICTGPGLARTPGRQMRDGFSFGPANDR